MEYYQSLPAFPRLSLFEELIVKAKQGSRKEINELVLRHIGFIAFRISKKIFPRYAERFGSDMLSKASSWNKKFRAKRV